MLRRRLLFERRCEEQGGAGDLLRAERSSASLAKRGCLGGVSRGARCEGLDRLRESLGNEFCTACRYCMDCPEGVDIPRLLDIRNKWKVWGLEEWARGAIGRVPEDKAATLCNECGDCEEKCPNNLPIREMLKSLEALVD